MKQIRCLSVAVFLTGLTALLFLAAAQPAAGQESTEERYLKALRSADPASPVFNLRNAQDLFQKLKTADPKDENAAVWARLIGRLMATEAEKKRLAFEKTEVENILAEKRKIITILIDQIQQMKEIDLAMEKQKREANSTE